MGWTRWKQAEKQAAILLGGRRRVRVGYNESIADIDHNFYSVEVKYGEQIPGYCHIRKPTLLYTRGKKYWLYLSGKSSVPKQTIYRKEAKFLERAFAQARSYNLELEPLVVLKSRGMHGLILVKELKTRPR